MINDPASSSRITFTVLLASLAILALARVEAAPAESRLSEQQSVEWDLVLNLDSHLPDRFDSVVAGIQAGLSRWRHDTAGPTVEEFVGVVQPAADLEFSAQMLADLGRDGRVLLPPGVALRIVVHSDSAALFSHLDMSYLPSPDTVDLRTVWERGRRAGSVRWLLGDTTLPPEQPAVRVIEPLPSGEALLTIGNPRTNHAPLVVGFTAEAVEHLKQRITANRPSSSRVPARKGSGGNRDDDRWSSFIGEWTEVSRTQREQIGFASKVLWSGIDFGMSNLPFAGNIYSIGRGLYELGEAGSIENERDRHDKYMDAAFDLLMGSGGLALEVFVPGIRPAERIIFRGPHVFRVFEAWEGIRILENLGRNMQRGSNVVAALQRIDEGYREGIRARRGMEEEEQERSLRDLEQYLRSSQGTPRDADHDVRSRSSLPVGAVISSFSRGPGFKVVFSPDDRYAAVFMHTMTLGGAMGNFEVDIYHNTTQMRPVRQFYNVYDFAFAPDGRSVLVEAGLSITKTRQYPIERLEATGDIEPTSETTTRLATLFPETERFGRYQAVYEGNAVDVVDGVTNQRIGGAVPYFWHDPRRTHVSWDGRYLILSGSTGLCIWDIESNEEAFVIQGWDWLGRLAWDESIGEVVLSPSNRTLAIHLGRDPFIPTDDEIVFGRWE